LKFELSGKVGDQMIAPLMFIPFIENSFKHGLSNQINHGYVHINLDVDVSEIKLEIKNSKAPTHPVQEHKRSGGIGLVNVKRRLDLIYPGKYDLEIKDEPNQYIVELSIELE